MTETSISIAWTDNSRVMWAVTHGKNLEGGHTKTLYEAFEAAAIKAAHYRAREAGIIAENKALLDRITGGNILPFHPAADIV